MLLRRSSARLANSLYWMNLCGQKLLCLPVFVLVQVGEALLHLVWAQLHLQTLKPEGELLQREHVVLRSVTATTARTWFESKKRNASLILGNRSSTLIQSVSRLRCSSVSDSSFRFF